MFIQNSSIMPSMQANKEQIMKKKLFLGTGPAQHSKRNSIRIICCVCINIESTDLFTKDFLQHEYYGSTFTDFVFCIIF